MSKTKENLKEDYKDLLNKIGEDLEKLEQKEREEKKYQRPKQDNGSEQKNV